MNNIESVILFQIDQTSKISKLYSQREFDRLGLKITVEQWILLKIIHEGVNMSQKELAEKSLRDPASITRTLDLLVKKGFVQRIAIPDNRRQYHITLSTAGQQFVNKNMELVTKLRQKSTNGISNEDLSILNQVLKKIQNNMS